jgi:hypothetical protein
MSSNTINSVYVSFATPLAPLFGGKIYACISQIFILR